MLPYKNSKGVSTSSTTDASHGEDDRESQQLTTVRAKEICNARLLLMRNRIDFSQVDLKSAEPIRTTRTKSGYLGTFEARNGRWQGQYLHRSLGAFASAYEAGSAVTRAVVQLARLPMPVNASEIAFQGYLPTLALREEPEQAASHLSQQTQSNQVLSNITGVKRPIPVAGSSDAASLSYPPQSTEGHLYLQSLQQATPVQTLEQHRH
eukprot:6198422-Pleurochrysis_carterae.AAC.1